MNTEMSPILASILTIEMAITVVAVLIYFTVDLHELKGRLIAFLKKECYHEYPDMKTGRKTGKISGECAICRIELRDPETYHPEVELLCIKCGKAPIRLFNNLERLSKDGTPKVD